MAGHGVRARRRSRRAARPDHQRPVCAALVRRRHARRPARLRVPARAGRRRHHGRGRRRRRGGGSHGRCRVARRDQLSRQVCQRRRCRQFRRVRGPGHRGADGRRGRAGHDDAARSPPHPLQQQHRRFHRPRGPEHEWRGVRLFRHAVLRPPGRAHAVPGLQQQHPRIPDQQHRRGWLHQLHARRGLAVLRRQQRQRRHRHDRPRRQPRGQQCAVDLTPLKRLVDHLRQQRVRIGDRRTEGARHNRRANRRAGQ